MDKKMSEVLEIEQKLKLRPATGRMFAYGSAPDQVFYGRIFYLKKKAWNHVEGPYSLSESHVQSGDFRAWLNAEMVYVKA
jgi:hypothetical protein